MLRRGIRGWLKFRGSSSVGRISASQAEDRRFESGLPLHKNMILEIKKYPNNILRQECEDVIKVGKEEKKLAKNMLDTTYQNDGAGLAAPQVGILKKIIRAQQISLLLIVLQHILHRLQLEMLAIIFVFNVQRLAHLKILNI